MGGTEYGMQLPEKLKGATVLSSTTEEWTCTDEGKRGSGRGEDEVIITSNIKDFHWSHGSDLKVSPFCCCFI